MTKKNIIPFVTKSYSQQLFGATTLKANEEVNHFFLFSVFQYLLFTAVAGKSQNSITRR